MIRVRLIFSKGTYVLLIAMLVFESVVGRGVLGR